MSARLLVPILVIALVAFVGCAGSPDPDEDMTWGDQRAKLQEQLQTELDRIDELADELEDAGDEASAFDESRRIELENMRKELKKDLSALGDQTRQTWNETARSIERRLQDVDDRLKKMSESMQ